MSNEISETWNVIRDHKKARHRCRVDSYPRILTNARVEFTSHNNGNHLILKGVGSFIDLWPGTDRFVVRSPYHKGIGIKKAIQYCRGEL